MYAVTYLYLIMIFVCTASARSIERSSVPLDCTVSTRILFLLPLRLPPDYLGPAALVLDLHSSQFFTFPAYRTLRQPNVLNRKRPYLFLVPFGLRFSLFRSTLFFTTALTDFVFSLVDTCPTHVMVLSLRIDATPIPSLTCSFLVFYRHSTCPSKRSYSRNAHTPFVFSCQPSETPNRITRSVSSHSCGFLASLGFFPFHPNALNHMFIPTTKPPHPSLQRILIIFFFYYNRIMYTICIHIVQ